MIRTQPPFVVAVVSTHFSNVVITQHDVPGWGPIFELCGLGFAREQWGCTNDDASALSIALEWLGKSATVTL